MPITINGVTSARVGTVALTLGGFSADLDGTHAAPPNRVGSANPTLGSFSVAFEGQFGASNSYDGSLQATLGSFTVLFKEDDPPVFNSTPAPLFTAGVPGTYDLSLHVTDDGLSPVNYVLTGTLPDGVTLNASTGILSYDGTGAVVDADDTGVAGAGTGIPVYAGVEFNTSGEQFANLLTNFTLSRGDWLSNGASSEVWVERVVNSGSLNWFDPGPGRQQLSASRRYGITRTSDGTSTANVTFNFYNASSGGILLDSVTLPFTVTRG